MEKIGDYLHKIGIVYNYTLKLNRLQNLLRWGGWNSWPMGERSSESNEKQILIFMDTALLTM